MFNFGGVTHVITNPQGAKTRYSLVGSVPTAMMCKRTPTRSDVLGGRVLDDGFAYVGKGYQSIAEIKQDAAACGAKLCTSEKCACHKLLAE